MEVSRGASGTRQGLNLALLPFLYLHSSCRLSCAEFWPKTLARKMLSRGDSMMRQVARGGTLLRQGLFCTSGSSSGGQQVL